MAPLEFMQNPTGTIAPAVGGSIAAIGGAFWSTISPDVFPVIGGIALGISGLGYSMWQAGRNRRADVLMEEIDELRARVKELRAELATASEDRRKLYVGSRELEGEIARLRSKYDATPDPD